MKLLFSLLVISNMCLAQDVKVIKKGETAPFDGVIFTREIEKDIREDIQRLNKRNDILTKLNAVNEKEVEILVKRVSLYQAKSKELADREVSLERDSFIKNALYFISGALVTGLITYGVTQTR
jgi:hypothetical protein